MSKKEKKTVSQTTEAIKQEIVNDQKRMNVFENFSNVSLEVLRKTVSDTRNDLFASRSHEDDNKWAVRYANGRRVNCEMECFFEAKARAIVLFLIDKVEAANKELADVKAKLAEAEAKAAKELFDVKAKLAEAEAKAAAVANTAAVPQPVDQASVEAGVAVQAATETAEKTA